MRSLAGRQLSLSIFSCLAATMAIGIGVQVSIAASTAPPAVAAKLYNGGGLARLWTDHSLRMPVIVQFAMPTLPDAASFASPAAADTAHVAAVHAAQDAILGDLFGNASAIAQAQAEPNRALKRMDFSPMFAMNVSAAELERLADDPKVVRIQADTVDTPALNDSVPLIGMPTAYAQGATGNGFRVAILDVGAPRTHEFLSSRITQAACFSSNNTTTPVSTSRCPGGALSSTDINSASVACVPGVFSCNHGSAISGIAAGFNTNLQSGEPANGVARDARILSINVYSNCTAPSQQLCAFISDQLRGLDYVYSLRNATPPIAAVNLSLGNDSFPGTHCDGDSRKPMIEMLKTANIATIAAGYVSPACVSSVIAVGASTKDDRLFTGSTTFIVDLAAPGHQIMAPTDTGYGIHDGTSIAAAHVTGAWAALRSRVPAATVDQIEAALKSQGVPIASASGILKPRIRVANALSALLGNPTPRPPNDNFANRIAITGSVTGSNVEATKEPGEPTHLSSSGNPYRSVWWSYTPAFDRQVTLDTAGSNFDTVLFVYTGSSFAEFLRVTYNNDVSTTDLTSRVTFLAKAGVEYQIMVGGLGLLQGQIKLNAQFVVPPAPDLVAAISPSARAAPRNKEVTTFATVINTRSITATDCTVSPTPFRTVASDGTTGPLNAPFDIPGNAAHNLVLMFIGSWDRTQDIKPVFDCTNTEPAPSVSGVNNFLFTVTDDTPADVISASATLSGDGIMNVPLGGTGVAAFAAMNIGISTTLTASLLPYPPFGNSALLPGSILFCRTDQNGQCLSPPTSGSVEFTATAGAIATFSGFFQSNGTALPFDPANKRIFMAFYHMGRLVGSTSIAVRTVAGGGATMAEKAD